MSRAIATYTHREHEELEQQRSSEAAKLFTSIVKGSNFMTPKVLYYEAIPNGAIELSFGEDNWVGKMWGVTVVRNGARDFDADRPFHSLKEAETYIQSLK